MGSKFCNLNLRGYVTADCLETLLPGLQSFPWENGWTTLTSPRLQWGQTQRYAAVLSKETGCPVLSAEYFDDDYAELAVYREGKRISRHVPATYEDLHRSRGNPDKFLEALEWDPTEAPRLKKVFQVEDPEEAVCLLESLLGCPIFGVSEDAPPVGIPGPEAIRVFAGEESPVRMSVAPRKRDKSQIPYAFTLERDPNHAGVFDSIFCYTDHPKKIANRLQLVLKMWEQRLDEEKPFLQRWDPNSLEDKLQELEQLRQNLRILPGKGLTMVWGVPMGNLDVDLPDLSREFKCLVAACRVVVKGENQIHVTVWGEDRVIPPDMERKAELHCGLAYGKKLLCFGRRGADPRYNKIMPEVSLESPWLTLPPGALVNAFERPGFWEAETELSELLGYPLYLERQEGFLVKDIQ